MFVPREKRGLSPETDVTYHPDRENGRGFLRAVALRRGKPPEIRGAEFDKT